jgi:hypothetical protein
MRCTPPPPLSFSADLTHAELACRQRACPRGCCAVPRAPLPRSHAPQPAPCRDDSPPPQVTLQKPLGVKFARGNDGGAYVVRSDPALGNTDSRIEAGDKVVKVSASFGGDIWEALNFGQVRLCACLSFPSTARLGAFQPPRLPSGSRCQRKAHGVCPSAAQRTSSAGERVAAAAEGVDAQRRRQPQAAAHTELQRRRARPQLCPHGPEPLPHHAGRRCGSGDAVAAFRTLPRATCLAGGASAAQARPPPPPRRSLEPV